MIQKIEMAYQTKFRIADSQFKDSKGNSIPTIVGKLSDTDITSPNGYRYKSDFWHTVLKRQHIKDAIMNREMLGCIEHPTEDEAYLKTPYDKASHVVLSVIMDGNNPRGTFGLLNNEQGNCLKALVDVGVPVGVSTRGLGDTLHDSTGKYVDSDNYTLVTWDVVRNPNFASLRMSPVADSMLASPLFRELTAHYQYRDSANNDSVTVHKSVIADMQRLLGEFKDVLNRL